MFGTADHNRTAGPSLGHNGLAVSLNYFTALPDPSKINDPQITVIFKALMKKHSTTKEKSLNDLLSIFDNPQYKAELASEEVICAWIQMYPKLALENPRNVRAVSHKIQANFLQLIGGKNFAKYLKSSVPVWLSGIFDADKVVASSAYSSLLESFQNDKSRVDSKLWHIFAEELVNFALVSVTQENKDSISDSRNTTEEDAVTKYDRLLNGSILVVNKLFELSIVEDFDISEQAVENLHKILDNEAFWDKMAEVFDSKTFNSALALAYLRLLRGIFKSDPDNKHQNKLCAQISGIKSLYKLVSKKLIKNVKLKKHKNQAQNIVYSTVILQFWGTLTVLTEFPTLSGKSVPKGTIWELGGSKAPQRLIDYLSLGPCNSDPAYYLLIDNFFQTYDKNSETGLTSPEFAEVVLDVLTEHIQEAKLIKFKEAAIQCLISFLSRVEDHQQKYDLIAKTLPKIADSLESNRQAGKAIAAVSSFLGEFFSPDEISSILQPSVDELVESASSGKHVTIELISHLKEAGETPSSTIVNAITEKVEESEDPATVKNGLFILDTIIRKGLKLNSEATRNLTEFTQNIAVSIEADTYEPVLEFIFSVLALDKIKAELNFEELVEDITTKGASVSPDVTVLFMDKLISEANWTSADFEKNPSLYSVIGQLCAKKDKSTTEWKILFKLARDAKILQLLIKSTRASNSVEFLKGFAQYGSTEGFQGDISELTDDLIPLVAVCWEQIDEPYAVKFIDIVSNSSAKPLVLDSLWKLVVGSNDDTSFSSVWKYISKEPQSLKEITERLREKFTNLPSIDKSTLAISNSLGPNIHLVTESEPKGDGASLIGVANLFSQCPSNLQNSSAFYAWCGVLKQHVSDIVFFSSQENSQSSKIDIQNKLSKLFLSSLDDVDLYTCLSSLFPSDQENSSVLSYLSQLVDSSSDCLQSYAARSFQESVQKLSDDVNTKSFESYDLEFYKLNKEPLKLGIVLSGLREDILLSSKFDRVRNFVIAELLGVKKSDKIVTDGVKWLVLSSNFLELNEAPSDYSPIPPHRLSMIIRQFQMWQESDVSYDNEFIVVRSNIIRFLTALIQLNIESLPSEFWDFSFEFLKDNLSMIQVEVDNRELRFVTLKLLAAVLKNRTSIEDLDKELLNNLCEETYSFFFNEDVDKSDSVATTPVTLCYNILERVFSFMKEYKDLERFEDFYVKLTSTKFIQIKRICVAVLHPLILEIQQDLVLEFQLRKSNLGDEGELSDGDIELPEQLLNYIENYDSASFNVYTYLSCWYLLLDCFKDLSYGIRNQYLAQLSKTHILSDFLAFVFDAVDTERMVTKKDVGITGDDIFAFESGSSGFLDEDKFNFDKLVLHIYFRACEFLGADVQIWYNGLRDIQMKQNVDKFTQKYISSTLTGRILEEVDEAKKNIGTDIMTVKVNKITKEVRSVFEIDEQSMEMMIKIPANFPLTSVSVEGPKRLGVKEAQWRAWLLSSQKVISLTNGSIVEAIEMFKKNVDLHFSGFEDCAICYSILHQDHSLPSKVCGTCSNKFHAGCLYKWFKSSGSSTCPLCRTAFNFRVPK